jgi:hypothetical protein
MLMWGGLGEGRSWRRGARVLAGAGLAIMSG